MHKEILNPNQIELLPLVKQFKREFYLAGGTAIALHIGHRRSIDFDLFKFSGIRHRSIINKIESYNYKYQVTRRVTEQLNVVVHDVKFTFYQYPFEVEAAIIFDDAVRIPRLLDLASMKAYALGRRSKWKDYVDLFFLLRDYFSIKEIAENATFLFGQLFSEKLFRAQLSYFDDIDYSEPVDYVIPFIPEEEVKKFLIDQATNIFE